MKTSIVLLLMIMLSALSCKKDEPCTPGCVQSMIREYAGSDQICPANASVKEYSFQGKTVYVFDPGNCGADMASSIFSATCEYVGMLGGIAGITKINGVRFDSVAVYHRTLWHN